MSDLVVLGFDGEHTADEVLTKLRAMQKEHLIDLEDACTAVRMPDGKVQLKQSVNLTAMGAASGGTWGALFGTLLGLLFLNPLAGLVVGGAAGAATGAPERLLRRLRHQRRVHQGAVEHHPRQLLCVVRAGPLVDPGQGVAGDRAVSPARPQDVAVERAGAEPSRRTREVSHQRLSRRACGGTALIAGRRSPVGLTPLCFSRRNTSLFRRASGRRTGIHFAWKRFNRAPAAGRPGAA